MTEILSTGKKALNRSNPAKSGTSFGGWAILIIQVVGAINGEPLSAEAITAGLTLVFGTE